METAELLMNVGRDIAIAFGSAPDALCRIDDRGWIGLSGEKDCADMNMAALTRGAQPGLVETYVREMREREVDALVIVDQDAPELLAAASGLGLTHAGEVPAMVWSGREAPTPDGRFKVRPVGESDVVAANQLIAEAFAVDEAKVQRACPPEILGRGADLWMAEDEGGPTGTGMFIRSGDHVGIYCMATPPRAQRRGIGRAVLETAMAHYLELGAATFTLEATEAGFPLYEKLGFQTVATPAVFVSGASTQFPSS